MALKPASAGAQIEIMGPWGLTVSVFRPRPIRAPYWPADGVLDCHGFGAATPHGLRFAQLRVANRVVACAGVSSGESLRAAERWLGEGDSRWLVAQGRQRVAKPRSLTWVRWHGFVVVALAGYQNRWNVSLAPTEPDDIAPTQQAISWANSNLCIDAQRLYATGFSGGARLSSRLACALPGTFAAIAPIAGVRNDPPCATTTDLIWQFFSRHAVRAPVAHGP